MSQSQAIETSSRAGRIRQILTRAFTPSHLDIEDESARHAGHAGARAGGETHYSVTIVSEHFLGLSRVERSRRVHQALQEEFQTGLHALSLSLRSPSDGKS
jgi:BolA protein